MLNVKPIRQLSSYCGSASLAMVLDYYGVKIDHEKLGKMCKTDLDLGTPAENLAKVAGELGFRAEIKDFAGLADIEDYVLNKKIPIIVDWFSENDGHYSVVVDINENEIFLADPEIADIRKLDRDTFMRVWFDYPELYPTAKDSFIIRRLLVVSK